MYILFHKTYFVGLTFQNSISDEELKYSILGVI